MGKKLVSLSDNEDTLMDDAQYITADEAQAVREAQSRLQALSIMLGEEIVD